MEIKPDYAKGHSNLVYTLNFCPGYYAAFFEEYRCWNRQHAEPLAKRIQPHRNDRSPQRRLRIGYVSPDFRWHPVGRFLLPLLESHNHTRFEIFCYASQIIWIEPLRVAALRRRVAKRLRPFRRATCRHRVDDQIDLLIDLTMHMANNRLLVFARKPARCKLPIWATAAPGACGDGLSLDRPLSRPA